MESLAYLQQCITVHERALSSLYNDIENDFNVLVKHAVKSIQGGGKIIFFGNGGSAADAQHLATELVVRFSKNRPAIAALALTTDSSALTAISNDFDFTKIFARQLEALARPNDLVIGISTSGKSPNVIAGLKTAKQIGAVAAGFSAGTGADMRGLADPLLCVSGSTTAAIQEMHILVGQAFCGALEYALGYA
jgi:D-sedoheptulose 7-phosphate isomerase